MALAHNIKTDFERTTQGSEIIQGVKKKKEKFTENDKSQFAIFQPSEHIKTGIFKKINIKTRVIELSPV